MTGPLPAHAAGHGWLWAALVASAAVLLVAMVAGLRGTASGPSSLAPAPVTSRIELTGSLSLGRDCGYSAPLPADPARSLWLFCDTPVYASEPDHSWGLKQFIPGSTAAVAATEAGPANRMPGTLTEVRTPRLVPPEGGRAAPAQADPGASGTPAPFLPAPMRLFGSDRQPCAPGKGSYAASWVSGVTRVPSTPYLLISFNDYCVLGSAGGFRLEGFGLAEYNPANGTLSHDTLVFSGPERNVGAARVRLGAARVPLGSPVFSGGYLYLFGPACSAPANGHCRGTLIEARVPARPQEWRSELSYQWYTSGPGGPWTSDAAAADAVVPGPDPAGLSVASFLPESRRLVLVEQTNIGGSFTVYQTRAPGDSWSKIRSGQVACRVGAGYANFCRALIAHPELSTPTRLVLSYYDPATAPRGHVMVQGFTW